LGVAGRKKISLEIKLAAALLTLGDIPYEDGKLMSARQICSLYHFDHYPILKVHDGPDQPWNLVPRLIRPHREKTKKDIGIIAKVKRLRAAPQAVAGKPKPAKARIDAPGPLKRTTGLPTRLWGIPGLRRKMNGEVVRR